MADYTHYNRQRGARERRSQSIRGGVFAILVVLGLLALVPSRVALAEAIVGDPLPTEFGPTGIGINPVTHRIYVTNQGSGTVTVIDSLTNATVGSPIKVGDTPIAVGVNTTTNRIYIANEGSKSVSVLDGASNTV